MPTAVRVIGLYSPKANKAEYEAFLSKEVASRNPINFSQETKAFLERVGRASEIVALTEDELSEIREEIDRELSSAVLVEVLVDHADNALRIADFVQPDPSRPPGSWQVAWCEKFLTHDGNARLDDPGYDKLPPQERYRIAFYIHEWKHDLGLLSSYGSLPLPQVEPMPSRLWKLAPYEQVD